MAQPWTSGCKFQLCILHFPSRTYDAYSTFFLNSQGLIRCHKIDKVSMNKTIVEGGGEAEIT